MLIWEGGLYKLIALLLPDAAARQTVLARCKNLFPRMLAYKELLKSKPETEEARHILRGVVEFDGGYFLHESSHYLEFLTRLAELGYLVVLEIVEACNTLCIVRIPFVSACIACVCVRVSDA